MKTVLHVISASRKPFSHRVYIKIDTDEQILLDHKIKPSGVNVTEQIVPH